MKITKAQVIKKLNEKGAIKECSRCGGNSFTVLDAYSRIMKKIDGNIKTEGGMMVLPIAVVACTQCGAITMHALGALGLNNEGE